MSNFITTDWLNLRSEPVIKKGNVISIMPPDTLVEKKENGNIEGWFNISTKLGKSAMEGFAASKYLEPSTITFESEEPPANFPKAVHLINRNNRPVFRNSDTGRAYPLFEPAMTKVNLSSITNVEDRKATIHNIISWLDVEKSERYSPTTTNTYCNIYAYDVTYCLGAYLPRVWWNAKALADIILGKPVETVYEKTVTELNANSLANWFEDYGHYFEWRRVFNLTDLQNNINKGKLGIIVAQRTNLNRSGHIVCIVPEKEGLKAQRDIDKVISPLQSQAGSRNRKYFTSNNWWEKENSFRKFSFWVWDV